MLSFNSIIFILEQVSLFSTIHMCVCMCVHDHHSETLMLWYLIIYLVSAIKFAFKLSDIKHMTNCMVVESPYCKFSDNSIIKMSSDLLSNKYLPCNSYIKHFIVNLKILWSYGVDNLIFQIKIYRSHALSMKIYINTDLYMWASQHCY